MSTLDNTHGTKDNELVVSDGAFVDPGLPEHRSRRADRDPRASRRAELQTVVLFAISVVGTIAMLVLFFAMPDDTSIGGLRGQNLALGLTLGFALLGIGLGAVHWAKTIMSDHEVVEDRHAVESSPEAREAAVAALQAGVEDSGIARRGVLKGAVVSALALFPLALAVPLVAEVGGDWNTNLFRKTLWKKGTRLTRDPDGTPVRAADVTIGSAYHIIPEVSEEERQSPEWITEKAKAVVLLVRLDPKDLNEVEGHEGWTYDGIIAFSKICTHVGCPVALYEQQTHHLLCPCHQSTFDVANGAKVVFGPAKRPLPQLPITVDADGYLVAQDGFDQPIGPSYWERLK